MYVRRTCGECGTIEVVEESGQSKPFVCEACKAYDADSWSAPRESFDRPNGSFTKPKTHLDNDNDDGITA